MIDSGPVICVFLFLLNPVTFNFAAAVRLGSVPRQTDKVSAHLRHIRHTGGTRSIYRSTRKHNSQFRGQQDVYKRQNYMLITLIYLSVLSYFLNFREKSNNKNFPNSLKNKRFFDIIVSKICSESCNFQRINAITLCFI